MLRGTKQGCPYNSKWFGFGDVDPGGELPDPDPEELN